MGQLRLMVRLPPDLVLRRIAGSIDPVSALLLQSSPHRFIGEVGDGTFCFQARHILQSPLIPQLQGQVIPDLAGSTIVARVELSPAGKGFGALVVLMVLGLALWLAFQDIQQGKVGPGLLSYLLGGIGALGFFSIALVATRYLVFRDDRKLTQHLQTLFRDDVRPFG